MQEQPRDPIRGTFGFLTTLAGASLLALLIGLGLEWAFSNFVFTPPTPAMPAGARVQHIGSGRATQRALDDLASLPAPARDALRRALRASLIDLDAWLSGLRADPPSLLCIGERHDVPTRRFLAERLLPGLPADEFMIESSPDAAAEIVGRHAAGESAVVLLGAPFADVLTAVRRANPAVSILGIDETPFQQAGREIRGIGSRDHSIRRNFERRFRPGRRTVVLFGALHCSDRPRWLFDRIGRGGDEPWRSRMLNVSLLARHEEGAVEALANFVEDAALARPDFVIPDTRRLPPEIYDWFPGLGRLVAPYGAAIVFDPCAGCWGPQR